MVFYSQISISRGQGPSDSGGTMVLGIFRTLHHSLVPGVWCQLLHFSRMLVWGHLHNLPIHFWDQNILVYIGNTIGRYIKMDTQQVEDRIFTFACICVEADLSKGLPDYIQLKHKYHSWMQTLDYENTTFSWWICQKTGNLQNSYPEYKKHSQRRKKSGKQQKDWSFPPPDPKEEEDGEEEMPTLNENRQAETQKQSSHMSM